MKIGTNTSRQQDDTIRIHLKYITTHFFYSTCIRGLKLIFFRKYCTEFDTADSRHVSSSSIQREIITAGFIIIAKWGSYKNSGHIHAS